VSDRAGRVNTVEPATGYGAAAEAMMMPPAIAAEKNSMARNSTLLQRKRWRRGSLRAREPVAQHADEPQKRDARTAPGRAQAPCQCGVSSGAGEVGTALVLAIRERTISMWVRNVYNICVKVLGTRM
jgi:hypothetical protein